MSEECPYKDKCGALISEAYLKLYCYNWKRCQQCHYFINLELDVRKEAAKDWD